MDAKTTEAAEALKMGRQTLQEREGAAISAEYALRLAKEELDKQTVEVRRLEAALLRAVADEACPPDSIPF